MLNVIYFIHFLSLVIVRDHQTVFEKKLSLNVYDSYKCWLYKKKNKIETNDKKKKVKTSRTTHQSSHKIYNSIFS